MPFWSSKFLLETTILEWLFLCDYKSTHYLTLLGQRRNSNRVRGSSKHKNPSTFLEENRTFCTIPLRSKLGGCVSVDRLTQSIKAQQESWCKITWRQWESRLLNQFLYGHYFQFKYGSHLDHYYGFHILSQFWKSWKTCQELDIEIYLSWYVKALLCFI